MLKEIKLDDRKYKDIRDEAVENIVKHCPEWTNHNPSDPGITIIELLSSMTEDVITRLNQVPEKNYLSFLDLIGIKQRLPRASMSKVTFGLSEGYQSTEEKKDTILIPKGSQIATEPEGDEEPILFETTKELYISNLKLSSIYSKTFNIYRQRFDLVDNLNMLNNEEPFTPFSSNGASDNITQIYLSSPSLEVFTYSAKVAIVFRLPTTMRVHKIKDDFIQQMDWEFYNGTQWQPLNKTLSQVFTLDDKDADILSVTFDGDNSEFKELPLEMFDNEPNYHIRATLNESPSWLEEFSIYEIGVLTSSYDDGALPNLCFHNFDNLNLNSDFYPFGARPKIDNKMVEEVFCINNDEAFGVPNTSVSIKIKQSLNPDYILPKGSKNLKTIWEYPVNSTQWNYLKVLDNTKSLTSDGTVSFEVPEDMLKIELNGEDGYWIRCKIVEGNFGEEEKSEYDEKSATVVNTPSTLRPPVLSEVLVDYTRPRADLDKCRSFNNFLYQDVEFVENMPQILFESNIEKEESMFLVFNSYISEDYLSIYFDIDKSIDEDRNIFSSQRVIEWKLLLDGKWITLADTVDETDGLTVSGDVKIILPEITKLEKYTLYMEEYSGMWIKAQVKFNSIKNPPKVNGVLLNTVDVVQQESFYDEVLDISDGLPNLQFEFGFNNLSKDPVIYVGDEEFKAVDRFIDYGKDDNVFRFNGVTGVLEFGDGEYGAIPKLGESITVREYSITEGKRGNVAKNELTVMRESINYIDSVTNYKPSENGENGDTLNDLKKYAPSVLKTMNRAISIEDYELLAQNFSPAIKKVKCSANDGEVVIIPLTENIIADRGVINKNLIDDLRTYLVKRSLITVQPIILSPTIVTLKVYIKLFYTVENYNLSKMELEKLLLPNASLYFDPFTGYKGEGFPLGKLINKGDFYSIVNSTDNNIFINDINFSLNGSHNLTQKVNLTYNQLVVVEEIIVEELNYDV